ncbi:GntR family transcriptional regulator [Clostridium sp. MT-14]|jgi:DNA-binding transcriptional regulator YhcF (GntR family)|uniref:GntR family transcriptional regulator n=1 Tax=Clostridium aromativorans TaxID=2836848 RepID=A0ABS8N8V1_9CLOT|nr:MULTISPECIES: GntR family transcriptional regulator [Clostridium]KAA8676370.1 GntR family transcriptional regulator [Clostridium sp. HV4-5-A1G]MCC9295143.1 GntR family transcriptional regulator [Clostridium aromativorans]CAB1248209.1 putative transcriptional regulator (GntR family) [Clostridiaceae bacterium BL-3]
MDSEFDPNIPIYVQIMNIVKKKIVNEELKPEDKLFSVREMSVKLKVNPNTIQRAYQELERQGIAYKQRGMGTFVSGDISIIKKLKKEMAQDILCNFIRGMKELGFSSKEIVEVVRENIQEDV